MLMTGNTILVTGGGSGIGAGLAKRFACLGNTVLIAGRRMDSLRLVASESEHIIPVQLDVTDADDVRACAASLVSQFPALNSLICSAGVIYGEDLLATEIDFSRAETIISTNLLGTIRVMTSFLPHLRSQDESSLICVTSGLGFVPLWRAPSYSATKAALHAYMVAVREHLRDSSVEVLEIVPPSVQTDMTIDQSEGVQGMPLAEFIEEVMSLLAMNPTPSEILVDQVKPFRYAERDRVNAKLLEMFRAM